MNYSEMKSYIEQNREYISREILLSLYDLGAIPIREMYLETRISVLQYQKEHKQLTAASMSTAKHKIMNEFLISQATFYRYLKNNVITITDPYLFQALVTTKKTLLVKNLSKNNNDSYEIISMFVKSINFPDKDALYYFEKKFSRDYCYRLWHAMVKQCYTNDESFTGRLIIEEYIPNEKGCSLKIIFEENNVSRSSEWHLDKPIYLSLLTNRISTWISTKYSGDDSKTDRSNIIIWNKSQNDRISRVLELESLVKNQFRLHK